MTPSAIAELEPPSRVACSDLFGRMNLLNGSFEIKCLSILVDQHPAIFAKRIQKVPLQECSGSFSLSGIKVQSTQMEEDVRLATLFVPIAKGLFDQPLDFIV